MNSQKYTIVKLENTKLINSIYDALYSNWPLNTVWPVGVWPARLIKKEIPLRLWLAQIS